MGLLETLYQDALLEHAKRPRHHGTLADATVVEDGLNASCGDEIKLYLRVADGVIEAVSFEGEGCAISRASASMMTEAILGTSVAEAGLMSERFKAMIQGQPPAAELGELKLFQGVSKLHARVKCATLPWVTLELAMTRDEEAHDEEAHDEEAHDKA